MTKPPNRVNMPGVVMTAFLILGFLMFGPLWIILMDVMSQDRQVLVGRLLQHFGPS
jgi:hypothetical protein